MKAEEMNWGKMDENYHKTTLFNFPSDDSDNTYL